MKRYFVIITILLIIIGITIAFLCLNNLDKDNYDWMDTIEDEDIKEDIFADVNEDYWASEFISYLSKREIMSNSGDLNFYPEQFMSLKDFLITVLQISMPRVNIENISNNELIELLKEKEILSEKFSEENLDSYATNYDAGLILAKADIYVRENEQKIANIQYEDLNNIDDVSRTLLGHSISSGFLNIKDSNMFYPEKVLTRAEIAEIIYLFLNS